MQFTLPELQRSIGGKLCGKAEVLISNVPDIRSAQPGEISFAEDIHHLEQAQGSLTSAPWL